MYYVGIDPGSQGAICLLNPLVGKAWFIDLKEDDHTIYETLLRARVNMTRCALEDVHSLYGMSAKSNFNFGRHIGRIQTILKILDMPFELVQPKKWQKVCGIPPRRELPEGQDLKEYIALEAGRLYPDAELYGPRGGLKDGRSDALMIAHYIRLTAGGERVQDQTNPEIVS